MNTKPDAQNKMIAAHLKAGKTITALEALQKFGCIRLEAEIALNHHKYKRCLAMASKCRLRARWFGDNAFYKKEQWALQWHKRWLELAEKFKEAK